MTRSRTQVTSCAVETNGTMISSATGSPPLAHGGADAGEQRLHLHLEDFGIGDGEAHAAMAEHRVDLGDAVEPQLQRAQFEAERLGGLVDVLLGARQEFVQRRIEQADGDRPAGHGR